MILIFVIFYINAIGNGQRLMKSLLHIGTQKKYGLNAQKHSFFLAKVISDKGVIEKFGNREYKYYYCGDYKYWIMSHWSKEILINRAKVNENK